MRPLLLLVLPLLALFAWDAAPLHADEVFVLDNDYHVVGRVIRETEETVVVRLSGLLERNTVTLRRSEIRKRYLQRDPSAEPLIRTTDTEALNISALLQYRLARSRRCAPSERATRAPSAICRPMETDTRK